jgi:hypothetical protein
MMTLSRIPFCGALLAVAACGNAPDALDMSTPSALETEAAGAELVADMTAPPGYTFSTVMSAEDAVPGGDEAYCFSADDLNDNGDPVFSALLHTGPVGAGVAYFRTKNGALELLGRTGESAPGGVTLGSAHEWFSGSLNAAGDTTFSFKIDGAPVSAPHGRSNGLFRNDRNGVETAILLPDVTLAPNGAPFRGVAMRTSVNNRADIVFSGMIDTSEGIHLANEPYEGLGYGIFQAHRAKKGPPHKGNKIKSLVSPGDPAPGGGTFDFAQNPSMNERGDVAFGAHVAGEECRLLGHTQAQRIFCGESVYLRDKHGDIVSIAHQDEPAPGGGTFRLAFGPVLNNDGDIAFIGDLTPAPGMLQTLGVFLHKNGQTVAVARPGAAMPGGGNMVSASGYVTGYDLSDDGEVVFHATLDVDDNQDGYSDTGVYAWKDGVLRLVVRAGMPFEDQGIVAWVAQYYGYGLASNNAGQVVFSLGFASGHQALVLATPAP